MSPTTRREFIKNISAAGLAVSVADNAPSAFFVPGLTGKKKVGIIGLDTSHSIEFTRLLNSPDDTLDYHGYKVIAAYPKGSSDIESAVSRIPGYTEEIKTMGVEIVSSIAELLQKTDVILLETNDGRLHLEQAMQVIKAGKPMFIDKPVAASLRDALAIYAAAEYYKVPVFSSSALRFSQSVQNVVKGKIGKISGADTYSPAYKEKTHPDFSWYGIHGIEILFAVMGPGCKSVTRVHTEDTDVTIGTWADDRIGTFRGMRSGQKDFGGIVFGEKEICSLGKFEGYKPLLLQVTTFFETGVSPFNKEETLEIIAFIEAADESKNKGGLSISLEEIFHKAKQLENN